MHSSFSETCSPPFVEKFSIHIPKSNESSFEENRLKKKDRHGLEPTLSHLGKSSFLCDRQH